MAYWLLKTEPSTYSAADLQREKKTAWDGVANPAALKNMRAMQPGDRAFIYHTGDEKQCVAIAEIVSAAKGAGKETSVDIRFQSMLPRPVTLAEMKADPAFTGWDLLRLGRLSVVPTADKFWNRVLTLASNPGAK